jgi:ATP-binding cassette subfamily B protein
MRGIYLKIYGRYIKKYWKPFLLAFTFLVVEAFCDLLQPALMSKIVDSGVAARDLDYVLRLGGIMLLITLTGAIGAVIRNIVSSRVSQSFGTDLRGDLFKKIQELSFPSIDKFERASLITRLTNDVTQVQGFFHGMMRIFVKAPIVCIGSLIMSVVINPKMAFILALIVPMVSFIIIMSMKTSYPYFVKVQRAVDKVNSVVREYLRGVRVVKAFNRYEYEAERFKGANDNLTSYSIKSMRVMSLFNPGISFTVNLGIIGVLWLGGIKVNNGQVQVGQIIAFINYMTQILFSLMMISNVFLMFVRARASAERIGEVLKEESANEASGHSYEKETEAVHNLRGYIEFDHVSFSYYGDAEELVLRDISIKLKKGSTIGIIGATGSGKSTLINLLPRFYEVTSGSIKIDNIDIKAIDSKTLREAISVVPQKTVLFSGSILENIKWGKEEASFEEVVEAARLSQAHQFIMSFAEGYNTLLGQGGVNLSGGQRQRIAIARALIKKPKVLVLDDSTSAVDMTTEKSIRESLKKYSEDTTTIVIAQRITSILDCDEIIVMNNGEIEQIGKHEELMKSSSIYRDIYRSQIGSETGKGEKNLGSK